MQQSHNLKRYSWLVHMLAITSTPVGTCHMIGKSWFLEGNWQVMEKKTGWKVGTKVNWIMENIYNPNSLIYLQAPLLPCWRLWTPARKTGKALRAWRWWWPSSASWWPLLWFSLCCLWWEGGDGSRGLKDYGVCEHIELKARKQLFSNPHLYISYRSICS